MALWLIRAGRFGEDEDFALKKNFAVIGYQDVPDLSHADSREDVHKIVEEVLADASKNKIANVTGQLWAFKGRIEANDLVVLPLKTQSFVAIGTIGGPYAYHMNRHVRRVNWQRTDVPRSAFGQDLLFSLGAFMTVCKIERNNAEERFKAILAGGKDPNLKSSSVTMDETPDVLGEGEETQFDLEEYALDQIRKLIESSFKGHDLARLVSEILKTQGYFVYQSPAGPDGGVDILAGLGPMGFDPPRLCVQVKSGGSVNDMAVRELEGVMGRTGANQGLFVSWGGFKDSVHREIRGLFFKVRLWDSKRIIQALLENYDRLPDDLQAELPLKRIWVPVLEEE